MLIKKSFFLFLLIALFITLIVKILSVRSINIIRSEEELLAKAKQEIPISDARNTEITIAGLCENEGFVLVWFISGNTYQDHYYFPIELKKINDFSYLFIKAYRPMNRGDDIAVLHWRDGTSFLINNLRCYTLRIEDDSGLHDEIIDECPYAYYNLLPAISYIFLSNEGNEIQ